MFGNAGQGVVRFIGVDIVDFEELSDIAFIGEKVGVVQIDQAVRKVGR